MFRLIWIISIYIRSFMRHFMPTNIALDALHTRQGLKWGAPAMLLAIPYCFAAAYVTTLIDDGAPNWLYVIALAYIWNALKFAVNGPLSVGLLVRVRITEARARHHTLQRADQLTAA